MRRRTFLSSAAATLAVLGLPPEAAHAAATQGRDALHPIWEAWKATHLDRSGRVIDALQDRASHSEGQGYGMALAAAMGDATAFDAMDRWTQANLAVRTDALLAWRWKPDLPERIGDFNNASDGDLFYAWALVTASERFADPAYLVRARAIAADLAATCVAERPDRPGDQVFLPAAFGFRHDDALTLNASYMMPRALRDVGMATEEGTLIAAAEGGLRLMADLARDGSMPDWVRVGPDGPGPAEGFSDRTGYEAIRVPLFLIWSNEAAHPAVAAHAARFEPAPEGHPVVAERGSGDIVERSAHAGYGAVHALARCAEAGASYSTIPPFDPQQPYYPATLQIFAMLAVIDALPSCRPV